jgi:hypothetical protein
MTRITRRWIQLVLVALLLAAGIRLVVVFRQRGGENAPAAKQENAPSLAADYYVQPRKLHDYDAASLRKDLAGQQVWIREGYRFVYYPCDGSRHHADFSHEGGTNTPIEKITIDDVVTQPGPGGNTQVLVVFSKDGHDWCLPVGVIQGESRQIFADDIFFYEDPHTLYKHWTRDVWSAIDRHEMKPGMNELQASFAIGMGVPAPGSERVLRYPNGGHPLVVTYENGVATRISPG